MSSPLIVIPLIRAQQLRKMRFAEDNDLVEAITSIAQAYQPDWVSGRDSGRDEPA